MKSRSRSSRNTMSLCKGHQKQPYKPNQLPPSMLVSVSVDLNNQINDKPRNFILANKKNLRNFFKDRIPQQKIEIGEKNCFISPSKIFKLRQQQFFKQQTTKITLHKSFDVDSQIHKTPSTKKMNETFHARGLQKISSSPSQTSKNFKFMPLSTYNIPTSSSLVKRSQTVKRQAYISVFGDKLIQQKSRMLQIESATNISLQQNKESIIILKPRPKTHLNCSRLQQERQKLNTLLEKIEGFAKFINPHRAETSKQKAFNPQFLQAEFKTKQQSQKNELVEWIKQASNDYKRRNENFESKRMRTVQDIERLDPMFYTKMKKHKNDRLWLRNKALDGINNLKVDQLAGRIQKINEYNFKKPENWVEEMLTITDRNYINTIEAQKKDKKFEQYFLIAPKLGMEQKLVQFGKNLIKAINMAKLYGIKFERMYIGLMKKRKHYELEGSYAFFKFIKKGDLQMLQNFVNKNAEYLYQIDNEQRTPLLYAVQNNKTNIIKYLVESGVNPDAKNLKGETPLAYSIVKDNYQYVQCLLQGGASPWSTASYNINSLVEQTNDGRIRIAIKNARKIHLALELIKNPRERFSFWAKYRQRIRGSSIISFL